MPVEGGVFRTSSRALFCIASAATVYFEIRTFSTARPQKCSRYLAVSLLVVVAVRIQCSTGVIR